MADTKVKIPKWAWAIIVSLVLSGLGYIYKRDVDALMANTKAINELNVSLAKIGGAIDTVRSDVQGTVGRLMDKVDKLEAEKKDLENRVGRLEGRR